VRLFRFH